MRLYEIKIKNRWIIVQAECMIELSNISKRNSDIKDFRVCGMMSISEMAEAKKSKHISFYV